MGLRRRGEANCDLCAMRAGQTATLSSVVPCRVAWSTPYICAAGCRVVHEVLLHDVRGRRATLMGKNVVMMRVDEGRWWFDDVVTDMSV